MQQPSPESCVHLRSLFLDPGWDKGLSFTGTGVYTHTYCFSLQPSHSLKNYISISFKLIYCQKAL